jgi:uncharacterized cupredoxin-like copper-binding protein
MTNEEATMPTKTHPSARLARRVATAGVALGLVAGACGQGSDAGTAAQATPDNRDYCARSLAIETVPEPDFSSFGALPPARQAEIIKGFTTKLVPLAEQVVAVAPAEVKADGTVLLDTVRKVNQTADPSGFDDPAFKAAEARTHAFDLANCGWTRADVTATEYSFAGMPTAIKAGPLSIQLTNTGKTAHDLNLFRINDGVTESVSDILALPESEAMKKVTMLGSAFAAPGSSSYQVFTLGAGRYGVACLVPLGDHHDGPPHASKGMFAGFTVA